MMGQIARGELRGDQGAMIDVDAKTRIAAFRALTIIGVPSSAEDKNWDGDWEQFTPDELERIVAGEHPDDVLSYRSQAVVEEEEPEEDFSVPEQFRPEAETRAPELGR